MKDLTKLTEIHGELKELVIPSGRKVIIRLQNGADDDILTNGKAINQGMAMCNYVSAIIVDSDFSEKGTLNPSEVSRLRLPDIYYIIISSRIFSLGNIVEFTYQWDKNKPEIPYEEDLNDFIWDFNLPFPEEPKTKLIPPISKDLNRELKLPSGKSVIYTFANTLTENYMANLPLDKQSKNQELLARGLKLKNEKGEYVEVEQFRSFNVKDMRHLRNDIDKHDPILNFMADIENPDTNEIIAYPVLATMDFFFPRGI